MLVSQLPSGGFGYEFPSISISPMTFLEITKYLEDVPEDPLDKYLFDIKQLIEEDRNILKCYLMDVDFLLFYKKLITTSGDFTFKTGVQCPCCGKTIQRSLSLNKDIRFKQIDSKVMAGAMINLRGHSYETIVPTVEQFFRVFEKYLKYRKIEDLGMIKTISLIKDFDTKANQIEEDVLGATHDDITTLMLLKDLYNDRIEPLELLCDCQYSKLPEERRYVTVSVDSLIVNFFREIRINCPIDGSKIVFKQIRKS